MLSKNIGIVNFELSIIEELDHWCQSQEMLDALECYYIDEYNSIKKGYNIREGGSRR